MQFIAARSGLRAILAGYLGLAPSEVAFEIGQLGKPALPDGGANRLFFNLSHSREVALVAVTRCCEIGVDVEQVREMTSADQLAQRFFHPNEVATFQKLPRDQRAEGFFNAWTRKEAFLKATGKGISYGIDRVEVTLIPGETARVLTVDGDQVSAAAWSVRTLVPAPGYVGAVALESTFERIACFTYGLGG
jgi:4'-phosphopantetheinyl transferase